MLDVGVLPQPQVLLRLLLAWDRMVHLEDDDDDDEVLVALLSRKGWESM